MSESGGALAFRARCPGQGERAILQGVHDDHTDPGPNPTRARRPFPTRRREKGVHMLRSMVLRLVLAVLSVGLVGV
ncbi:MAG: hypothetical protein KDA27_28115, partial [Candidatus Eisenbacteria bacterium]|nr:hypothetical protein [Candidatus Eisenbacteria bacterium]